jgi:hypothetical protein
MNGIHIFGEGAHRLAFVLAFTLAACGSNRSPAETPGSAAAEVSHQSDGDVEQELVQLEHAWTEAQVHEDLNGLDRAMADDYIGQGPVGAFTKAQYMADAKAGYLNMESQTLGPLKVRLFDTVAIVTGSDDEVSSYRGRDISGRYIWTDVWVRRNGRWQLVASQAAAASHK